MGVAPPICPVEGKGDGVLWYAFDFDKEGPEIVVGYCSHGVLKQIQ